MNDTPTNSTENLNERIVRLMNELVDLVDTDITWILEQDDISDYSLHVGNLEANLRHTLRRLTGLHYRLTNNWNRFGKNTRTSKYLASYGRNARWRVRLHRIADKLFPIHEDPWREH